MNNAPKYLTSNGWNLVIGGSREVYLQNLVGAEWQFVGRFKHGAPAACAKHFARFLVANFTPAEYFAALAAPHACGFRSMAPAEVLRAKGYVSYHEERHARELARAVAQPHKF